ncbi:UNVERIFIED_CONTAM: hypothetical protein NCL1_37219 [Trichonephila clavipes]
MLFFLSVSLWDKIRRKQNSIRHHDTCDREKQFLIHHKHSTSCELQFKIRASIEKVHVHKLLESICFYAKVFRYHILTQIPDEKLSLPDLSTTQSQCYEPNDGHPQSDMMFEAFIIVADYVLNLSVKL